MGEEKIHEMKFSIDETPASSFYLSGFDAGYRMLHAAFAPNVQFWRFDLGDLVNRRRSV